MRTTESAFRGHPMWRDATEDELEASGEGLEKYLMTKLHPLTFAAMPDDKRVDAHLSKRIAALRTFIRPEHLDIPERYHVEASLQLAEGELSKVNLFKAPRDKVVCVLNTCRIINNLLNVSSGNRPPGADDFLPVLIYVVLRANPPDLESNLRYIARFRRDSRLVSEAAYFYTNLVSATHFLTKCDHAAFTGLDADVFEAHMAAEGIDVRAEAALATEATGDDAADAGAGAATDDPPARVRTDADGMPREGASNASTGRRPPPPPGSPPRRDREADDARRTVARLEAELADARRRLAEAASAPKREPLRWRTVEDVEAEGAASVEAEDTAGTLRLPYQFLYARSDDLQVGDVPALLGGYKSLALQYEAVSRGVAAVLASVGDETAPTVESAPGPVTPSSPEEMITVVSPLNRSSADVDGLGAFARGNHATTASTTNAGLEDAFAQLGGLGGDGVTGVDARDPFAGLAALNN